MALQIGIVGLPNVGKSTLFNALTQTNIAEAANYPFCTIEPNVGTVIVPDDRLDYISKIFKPQKITPTQIKFVDIAGLVQGASKGEGLGNKFLSHIRETDAIIHIVRCFEDTNISHVMGDNIDAIRDIEIIRTELLLSDIEAIGRKLNKITKVVQSSKDKDLQKEYQLLKKLENSLNCDDGSIYKLSFDEQEKKILKDLNLISFKPVLFVANIKEEDLNQHDKNLNYKKIKEYAQTHFSSVLSICSKIEAEIVQLDFSERMDFLSSLGLKEPGLHLLIREAYKLLNLETFFTAGPKEVRAWTVKKDTFAPQAAGVIHSDFEKGFIRVEVYNYKDLVQYQNEQSIKEAGKYRIEGKNYIVQDGDIVFFRFNV